MLIKQGESTAARRKVFFFATDSTDGVSAKTGLSFSGSDLQICKAGGSFANAANTGTVSEKSDGLYELELSDSGSPNEVDTFGDVALKLEKSGVVTRIFVVATVVAYDPYDSVRMGQTALPNAAANAANGLPTNGSGSGQISLSSGNVTVGGYASGQAPLQPTTAGRTLDVSAGGAAGVDLANVEGQGTTLNLTATTIKTATDVETDTQDIQSRLPAALVGGRMDADVGNVQATPLADVADVVLDELLAGHVVSGSLGAAISDILSGVTLTYALALQTAGLLHLNSKIDGGAGQPAVQYTGDVATGARLRVFASKTDADNSVAGAADDADGEILRFDVVATVSGGKMATYKLVQTLP